MHNDAYRLMEYTCKECGYTEKIWNSRNAVSPFSIGCVKCTGCMTRTNRGQDIRIKDYTPPKGSRYFADLTYDRAVELAKKRVESAKGTPYELSGEKAEAMIQTLTEEFLSVNCSMDLLTA